MSKQVNFIKIIGKPIKTLPLSKIMCYNTLRYNIKEEIKMEISKLIESIINMEKINQTDFAQTIGSTQAQVSDWISGKSKPSYEKLQAIGFQFKIDGNDLLDLRKSTNNNIIIQSTIPVPILHVKNEPSSSNISFLFLALL